MEEKRLVELYTENTGKKVSSITRISGSGGGGRVYYRITGEDGSTMFGIKGTNAEENESFYNLSLIFGKRGFNVPKVYGISDDKMFYLQQDLGTTTLAEYMKNASEEEKTTMLDKVISCLPKIQFEGRGDEVYKNCYPVPSMDEESIMFDLNYFKYCFLKLQNIEFNEVRLEHDFRLFTKEIMDEVTDTFMYRDFQARNVMIYNDTPYFIDYQGGRRGPIFYDVASFVWQASAKYSNEMKQHLIKTYQQALASYVEYDAQTFTKKLQKCVLFRTLQVLGAYGFRGLWEKKQQFIDSIPQGLNNLKELIDSGILDKYPELCSACKALCSSYKTDPVPSHGIRVMSFSFKKGIPTDKSGNGGGYVFDCRSTENPGRYDEYKQLTGLDKPVIDFLEDNGEILSFLDNVYNLVDFHVQRYIDRGFSDLMICFGCTGGQHRSVYSAQHVAQHIFDKFHVPVSVYHREQNIFELLK